MKLETIGHIAVGAVAIATLFVLMSKAAKLDSVRERNRTVVVTNTVFVTNYITATKTTQETNVWKCPHHNNPWHEVTENCADYERK